METTKWISVNDRLPESNLNVLVFESGRIAIAQRPTKMDFAILNDTYEKEWPENTFDNADWHFPSTEVTHWMPLPEPPKL